MSRCRIDERATLKTYLYFQVPHFFSFIATLGEKPQEFDGYVLKFEMKYL